MAASISAAASVKWAACRSRVAAASPSAPSSSAAYSRRLSRRTNSATPPWVGLRTRLLSRSEPTLSSTSVCRSPHTCSAASRFHAPTKTESLREERALVVGEQAVAPLERGPQRAVAGGGVAGVGREHRHAVAQPVGELGGGEELRPRGGQLQRQGEAVEPTTDLRDGVRVARGHREGGLYAADARDEHRDRGHRGQALGVGRVAELRHGERRDGELPFRGEVQPFPTRHQQPDPRAGLERLGEVEARREHLLAVVHDEQHLLVGQRVDHPRADGPAGSLVQPQCARDLAEDQPGVLDRGQVDEDDAVGEARRRLAGHREGEPGLADARRAGEGEQPRVGLGERRQERGELGVAADQGERRTRKARGAADRPDRRLN